MEVKITATNLQEALDKAFRDYGIVRTDVIDFNQSGDEWILEVTKTIESEVELNAKVTELVKSNQFTYSDTAFICSDEKVHTPEGSNLFDRLKSLLSVNLVPLVGFTNFIDASDSLSKISDGLTSGYVAFNDLILSKEGNLLKGSRFTKVSKLNSKLSDPVMEILVTSPNPEKLLELINKVANAVGFDKITSGYIENDKTLVLLPTYDWPIDTFPILFTCLAEVGGKNEIEISDSGYKFIGSVKKG